MTAVRSVMSIIIIVTRFCLICGILICCKFIRTYYRNNYTTHWNKSDYEVNTRRIDEYMPHPDPVRICLTIMWYSYLFLRPDQVFQWCCETMVVMYNHTNQPEWSTWSSTRSAFLDEFKLAEKIILLFFAICTILGNTLVLAAIWRESSLH